MKLFVASIMLLLSLTVGVMAIIKLNTEHETSEKQKSSLTASMFFDMLKIIKMKEWILLSISATFIAFCTYHFCESEMDFVEQGRFLLVGIILIPIMVIDWYTHRIPNGLILLILGLGGCLLLVEFFIYPDSFIYEAVKGSVGFLICIVLFYILSRLTKDGIGMGDVKLIAAMGWILGLSLTIMTVMFALVICSLAAIILLIGKKKNKEDHIAFGPFMFFGYICTLLLFAL